MSRTVVMRDEHSPRGSRSLTATIDENGALQLSGQDLGAGTKFVSADGEYEWFVTFLHAMLPELLHVLGAPADANILDVIQSRYCGAGAEVFDQLVRDSDLKPDLFVFS